MPEEPDELDEIFDAYEDKQARMARELEEHERANAGFRQAFTDWVDRVAVPTLEPFVQRIEQRSHHAHLKVGESQPRVDDGSLVLTLSPGPKRHASKRVAFFAHASRRVVAVEVPAGSGGVVRNEHDLGELTPRFVQSVAMEAIVYAFES